MATTTTNSTKKLAVVSATIAKDGQTLECKDYTGKTRVVPTSAFAPAVWEYAALYGLKVKMERSAAAVAGTSNVTRAKAFWACVDRLAVGGPWDAPREGVERQTNAEKELAELVSVVAEAYGKTVEWAATKLTEKSDAERAAMRQLPRVKTVFEAREAARLAKLAGEVDLDELESGLLDDDEGSDEQPTE